MKNRIKNEVKEKYVDFKTYIKQILMAEASYRITLMERINMKIRGFTPDQYVLYNLKYNNIDDYISEMERWKSRRINGKYNLIMDDKLLFPEVFGQYVNVPKNLAWIKKGEINRFSSGCFTDEEFLKLIYKEHKMFLKPNYGGGGRGIYLIEENNDKLFLNNHLIEIKDLLEKVRSLDDYIISEFIIQNEYSSNIFNKTTNTIRILTIIQPEDGRAAIIDAVHRIGIEDSVPVDNASRGALVAKINLDTGIIGIAKTYFDETQYEYHPDSKSRIKGIKIPFWNHIKKVIVEAAENFPYVHYMAWDVVVTEEGFSVIEINASTGLDLVQMWEGKRNSELGDFFKYHGIIK